MAEPSPDSKNLTLFSFLAMLAGDDPASYFSVPTLKAVYHQKLALAKAAGKDGVRGAHFAPRVNDEVAIVAKKIERGSFRFTAYKERLILRGPQKAPRQISIPTIRDRIVMRSLCNLIHKKIANSVGNKPHTLIDNIINTVTHLPKSYSFVRIDVKDFYPSISHSKLKKELELANLDDIAVDLCMKAIQTPTGKSKDPPTVGIPQGLSISNSLAQIYMNRFDGRIQRKVPLYFRYVDDILCICPSSMATSVYETVRRGLSRHGLRIHPLGQVGKSEIKPITEHIEFLGYAFNSKNIWIKKPSYDRMFHNLFKIFTDFKYKSKNDALMHKAIYRINLKITGCIFANKRRGWMIFFSRTQNLSQLKFLDRFVYEETKKIGLSKFRDLKLKTFIRTYYEVKFNLDKSSYIPNFDNLDRNFMIDTVYGLTKYLRDDIEAWSDDHLQEVYLRAVSREVSQLEQDIGTVS